MSALIVKRSAQSSTRARSRRQNGHRGVVSDKVRAFYYTGSAIRKMFEEGLKLKAQYGAEHVADMSIGNPEFAPPEAFTRALRHVAEGPAQHAYMPNAGYPSVRAKVADYLNRHRYFEGIQAEHIVMTTGAAGALNVVLKTILDPGDEVIVPRPYFLEYRFYIDSHGGQMVLVDPDDAFGLDVEKIAAAVNPHTRALLINSPHNPTGRVYSRGSLEALAAMLRQKEQELGQRIFLLSDEPYREVIFDGRAYVSPASLYTNSFMCYSWSKAFSIPGERIGYVAVNPNLHTKDWPMLTGSLAMCNRFLGFLNAPAFMQHVIAEALDAELDVRHYEAKRDRLCAVLDAAGYDYAKPEGAFYIFVKSPIPEMEFVARAKRRLLLVTPGKDFGWPGYVRVCFAYSDAIVDLASRKLTELAQEIHAAPLLVV